MKQALLLFLLTLITCNAFAQVVGNAKASKAETYSDGFILNDTVKYHDSITYYTQLIALYPDSADLYGHRAYYKMGIKDSTGFTADYNKALRLEPGYNDEEYSLGLDYWRTKQYVLAEKHFRKALSLNPNDTDIKYSLGMVLYAQDRYEDALHYLLKAINVGRFYKNAVITAGYCALEVEDYQTALNCFDTLLAKEEKALYYCLKARALIGLERYAWANKNFALCLEIDPEYVDAYYYRAYMKYNRGDKKGACADFYTAAKKGDGASEDMLCEQCEPLCQKLNTSRSSTW